MAHDFPLSVHLIGDLLNQFLQVVPFFLGWSVDSCDIDVMGGGISLCKHRIQTGEPFGEENVGRAAGKALRPMS
jgi:hypothetical protein